VPPVPLIQLTIFLVPQTLNAPLPPLNGVPLILNPVSSTRSLSQLPAAKITVLHKPAAPTIEPIIVLFDPVVTEYPELHPKNKLFEPVVLYKPAAKPMKWLLLPVVLD
jgi:hypothetical protein